MTPCCHTSRGKPCLASRGSTDWQPPIPTVYYAIRAVVAENKGKTCPYGEVLAHRLVRAEPRVPSARCISERPCRTDQNPAEGQPLNEIVAKWRGHRCMPLRQLKSSHSRWPLPS